MSVEKLDCRDSKQIIVTGATGFIGRHLIPLLLELNYSVIAVSRDSTTASSFEWYERVQFVELDIHDYDNQIEVEEGARLFHLAWQGLPNYTSLSHIEINLPANYKFVKAMVQSGVSHVLVTGTCFEYGMRNGSIDSSTIPCPQNSYAIAKNSLRQQLELLSQEESFDLQWARVFYTFGPGQHPNSLISQLDLAIDRGDATFNMSAGDQLRDYLPVERVVKQLVELFSSSRVGVFNICKGDPVSVRQVVEDRIQERGADLKLNIGFYPESILEPKAFWGVRDVGETTFLPKLPNAPVRERENAQSLAPIRLRFNPRLNFLENEAFTASVIDYSEDYENSQAYSSRFLEHMSKVLSLLKSQFPAGSRVVEVGCGKGDFLEMVRSDGYFNIQGFDASYDGSSELVQKRYLNSSDRISADLVVLRHVLEHIQRPHEFLLDMRGIFPGAKVYIEVPDYDWIIANNAFFDITYEHVNYFSKKALRAFFSEFHSHGGPLFSGQYQYVIAELSALSVNWKRQYDSNDWQYVAFEDLFPNIQNVISRIDNLVEDNSIFLWGAATKGCLFLAHCATQKRLISKIPFAIDQNPKKIGKYLPGSGVLIKSKEDFFSVAKSGDVVLVANPAYKDEIFGLVSSAVSADIIIESL